MVKVAVYSRVSTDRQELGNQLDQLREFAKKKDWLIFKVYSDVISGKENSRPAFDELFKHAHQLLFDGVLFWSLDRFSRSGTLFTLQKLKELENLGLFYHSYQDPYISTAGQWKDVIISVMSTLAKLERERISERTKAGLQRAKANGKKIGRSSIPDDAVAEVIRLLDEGKSFNYIHGHVTYKIKYGKIKHVSKGKISEIKKSVQKGRV